MDEINPQLTAFDRYVTLKYQLYNSLFLTLPFENLEEAGIELPVFAKYCHEELENGASPLQIINSFFSQHLQLFNFNSQMKVLFLFLQFVERQVVLFDAIEDAAFSHTHDMSGEGTLNQLSRLTKEKNKFSDLYNLLQTYRTRIVLTAHPTQFYPAEVIGIIEDLSVAVKKNKTNKINDLLLQMGKTSFKNPHPPTPIDEAHALMHFLENIFYPVFKEINYDLSSFFDSSGKKQLPSILELGFWPGGDRDGNPFVTAGVTVQVAKSLKFKIIHLYVQDIDRLKRRLTFHSMWDQLDKIKHRLIATQQITRSKKDLVGEPYQNDQELLNDLQTIRKQLISEHNGLFIEKLEKVITTVHTFGFYFASLDLRQNSRIHAKEMQALLSHEIKFNLNYNKLSEQKKINLLTQLLKKTSFNHKKNPSDSINVLQEARLIQQHNGEMGLNRYIISNTESASDVLEVMLFARKAGWSLEKLTLDIVPLFETVVDLENAKNIMRELFSLPIYRKHVRRRNNRQIVMLGFSDGTKDGGYLTANWKILQCKIALYHLSLEFGIQIIFFDGRGGPPSRGGGNTHKFYRAIEGMIEQPQIQLTIQGQTISTNFGNKISARYNVCQLMTSGLLGDLLKKAEPDLLPEQMVLLENLSSIAYQSYQDLKNHPLFLAYLENRTPLNYFGELNIASRPPRRSSNRTLKFSDLRAIPFVGAWAQMKQNVPGYYGLGTALNSLVDQGQEEALKKLYQHSLYFRTLLENGMQSLKKSNFLLTQYLKNDKVYGEFWQLLNQEAQLSIEMLKRISGQQELLANDPIIRSSIDLREEVVFPLLVIQQYAMQLLRIEKNPKKKEILRKIIIKSIAANTNASRNSA